MEPRRDAAGDWVCEHGVAVDVHCCGCHAGFIFGDAIDHDCAAELERRGLLPPATPPGEHQLARQRKLRRRSS